MKAKGPKFTDFLKKAAKTVEGWPCERQHTLDLVVDGDRICGDLLCKNRKDGLTRALRRLNSKFDKLN